MNITRKHLTYRREEGKKLVDFAASDKREKEKKTTTL